MTAGSDVQLAAKLVAEPTYELTLPQFYLLNATSLAKTSAKEHAFADARTVRAKIVLIVETWFTRNLNDADLKLHGWICSISVRQGQ